MNTQKLVKNKPKNGRTSSIINDAKGLDQWEQGAVRHHKEGQSLYCWARATAVNVYDGDVDVDAGEQMG